MGGGKLHPYNPNLVFVGISFDEKLCFNAHYANLRVKELKKVKHYQNIALKNICPTVHFIPINGIICLRVKLLQLGARYLTKLLDVR